MAIQQQSKLLPKPFNILLPKNVFILEIFIKKSIFFYQYTKIITESAMCGKGNLNGDGRLDVLDIDELINRSNGLISTPIKSRGAD